MLVRRPKSVYGKDVTHPTMMLSRMTAVMTAPSMKSCSEKDRIIVIRRTIVKLLDT